MALSPAERSKVAKGAQRKARRRTKKIVVVNNGPKRNGAGRRRGGRRQRGGRRVGRNPLGIDGVGIQRGGEIVNSRTHSAPEIREGEELISTVNGSVGFVTTQFNVNPANATTFPWLNKIAQLFERYEFEMLSFHFGHDVSGFATQGQTGLVYLSALYDAASAAPTSVTQIEATDPFVPCMPNQDSCLRLDKKSMFPANEPKFCLQGNPPGGTDIKTYNCASVFVSTTGMANTSEIGKFRVKYRVKCYDRILDASQAAAPANFSVSLFQSTTNEALVTTVTKTLLVATATANGLAAVNTAGSVVLPAGNYLWDFDVIFKDTGAEAFAGIILPNKNGAAIVVGTNSYEFDNPASIGAGEIVTLGGKLFVTSNGTDAFTLQVNATGAAGTLTAQGFSRFTAA